MSLIKRVDNQIQVENFVGGQWKSGQGESIEVESPYFGDVVAVMKASTQADVDEAVGLAKQAQIGWEATPLKERTQVLFRFRENLLAHLDEMANTVSLESGKTLGESRAGILKGVEVLEFALSLQNLDQGGRMEVSRGVSCEYRRIPKGVVASLTPFNFPAMVPMWTIPIAIVLGNAYIWKPSEKTPITSKWIADLFTKAGLPAGILTVLQGGADTAQAVVGHSDVSTVSFVGSTSIAERVYQQGTAAGKRVLALGGAKNHIVLLPDADLDLCGKGISDSFTGCAGQRCMAASVVLAVGDSQVHIDRIVQRAKSLELGRDMGAIITKQQLQFLHESIEKAEAAGAKILLDGRKATAPADYKGGFWLGPTVLDQVLPESEAARIELFGPIISIIRCQTISEAMQIENSNAYGNACSVFTKTGALAERVIREAKAGMVGVNVGVPVPREPFSFGGIGLSKFGQGEITGEHSLPVWSDLKKVTIKWEAQSDANWMS